MKIILMPNIFFWRYKTRDQQISEKQQKITIYHCFISVSFHRCTNFSVTARCFLPSFLITGRTCVSRRISINHTYKILFILFSDQRNEKTDTKITKEKDAKRSVFLYFLFFEPLTRLNVISNNASTYHSGSCNGCEVVAGGKWNYTSPEAKG
jgi:hypothetical protein